MSAVLPEAHSHSLIQELAKFTGGSGGRFRQTRSFNHPGTIQRNFPIRSAGIGVAKIVRIERSGNLFNKLEAFFTIGGRLI